MLGVVRCPNWRGSPATHLSHDPHPPLHTELSLSDNPLLRCAAQTFPACISHFGRPLFQVRKFRAWDSPDASMTEACESPTRQPLGFRLGKGRGWTRMIFTVSSSSPRLAATPLHPARLGIAVP